MKAKFNIVTSFIIFISASVAVASGGGMIGGGDEKFKVVHTCAAESMDPTFVSKVASVSLVKEVDYDGNIVPDSKITLLMIDKDQTVLQHLVTHQSEMFVSPDNTGSLNVWKYAEGTENNLYLATFLVQFDTQTGHLVSFADAHELEELSLSQCQWVSTPEPHF